MISIELSKKLKVAGLKWEPKKGDWFIDLDFPENTNLNREDNPCLSREYFAWLPSLSDLLAEIERRGYGWLMENKFGYAFMVIGKGLADSNRFIRNKSPDDGAGQALLWIMEQEDK